MRWTAPQRQGSIAAMTAPPAGYRTAVLGPERTAELVELDRVAFAFTPDPETDRLVPLTVPMDRAVGIDGPDGTLAAQHASYPFDLPVPGGSVPCSGLTWVGVHPAHRRRGLLTSMIGTHLERSLARGEVVSALFAAEASIYGRFGYGSAADQVRVTLPRGAALRPVPGSDALALRFDALDPARHGELLDALHRSVGAGRPGWVCRDTAVLRERMLVDPPAWRDGGEAMRVVTVHDGDEPVAAARVRRKEVWRDGRPLYSVSVHEALALTPAAAHRMWSFLLDLDLTATVEAGSLAPDDPLLHLLVDRRQAGLRLGDNVWVRLLDLPAALAGRRYAADLDLVLEVSDGLLPANAGQWRLQTGAADPDGWRPAQVTASDAPADLVLDVRELGAAYLGGRSFGALAAAGLVRECSPGALLRADAAFASPRAPFCSWIF